MGLDFLEYEVEKGFPEFGNDLATWSGFQYTEANKKFEAFYLKSLNSLLNKTKNLRLKISEATDQLSALGLLTDDKIDNAHLIDLYNQVFEMHVFCKDVYRKVKNLGIIESEIDTELLVFFCFFHN
jgi:hypothetical protein